MLNALGLRESFANAALFMVFSSQMIYATIAHVANDWLAIPIAAMLFASFAKLAGNPSDGRRLWSAALWLGAGLLTKAYFLVFVLIWIANVAFFVAKRRMKMRPPFLASLSILAFAGPWYVRNMLLYGNVTGTQEAFDGIGIRRVVEVSRQMNWPATTWYNAHAFLWTGNNSFTSFSTITLNLALVLLAAAFVLWIAQPEAIELSERVTAVSVMVFMAALAYAAAASYAHSDGKSLGASPWYAEIILTPIIALAMLGMSRMRRLGATLAAATVVLWSYILVVTWTVKLFSMYSGRGRSTDAPADNLELVCSRNSRPYRRSFSDRVGCGSFALWTSTGRYSCNALVGYLGVAADNKSALRRFGYISLLACTFIVGLAFSWTSFGQQLDNYAYDFFFRLHQPAPWQPESIILAADEESFSSLGGLLKVRQALARGLESIAPVHPRAVAIDFIFTEAQDPSGDRALESAFRATPHLVLACDLISKGERWDEPLPIFRQYAAAVGHIQADLDPLDAISREIPLEKATAHDRRWALSLEAFRVSRSVQIVETPDELRVGSTLIPSSRANGRSVRIRYAPLAMNGIPRVSLKQLADHPELAERFRNKVVFAGTTALTAVRDRWMTPLSGSVSMPGIEIHANAFETFAHGVFLRDVSPTVVFLAALLAVALAGFLYSCLNGWHANAAAAGLLLFVGFVPYLAFTRSTVFPFTPVIFCAWLSVIAAAAWQHVVVRKQLGQSEAARAQYRETMQFVTHEMKTPLTAIQGSSELMGRYALPEEKRKQMANMINSESKRLAQMIETFLNAERLAAGQMDLKRERFSSSEILERCVERIRPVADRKTIQVHVDPLPSETLNGDRELMEYAFYNLLTNAVKYSPPDTVVTVSGTAEKGRVRVSVADQGVGIDPKDARRIFEKFYRTKSAEQGAEKGTGIGLSIVEQIVERHGGSIAVESAVGKGSTFTVSLPVAAN